MDDPNDQPKLPPGCVESPALTAPIVTGTALDNGTTRIPRPELIGIQCEVQHPGDDGLIATEPGMIGFGVVLTDEGPIVMVQVTHPDGAVLTGFLRNTDELQGFNDCFHQACRALVLSLPQAEGEA